MSKIERNFYLEPLDIYDTLMAKEKRLSIAAMLNIAREKGVLLSGEDSRESLARYLSSIPFDYGDISRLYDLIESDARRDKTTSSRVKKELKFPSILTAVNTLNDERSVYGEVYSIVSPPSSQTVVLDVRYIETDFSKARMLQKTRKDARIEFNIATSDTLIRYPANDKCGQIVRSLIKKVENGLGDDIVLERIELSNIVTAEKRNDFFFKLMDNLSGMPAKDVVSVRMMPMNGDSDEDAQEEEENSQLVSLIKRVSFDGQAITASKEYKSLVDKGFFISNVTWKACDMTVSPNILVELEAGFAVQGECKDFKYAVKGTYAFEKEANGFSLYKKTATELDRIKYLGLIERAAKSSLDEVSNVKN